VAPHQAPRQPDVARRTAEGKTIREIKRCLKRYVARQLYRRMEQTPGTASRGVIS
jgi:hypothetical protein